MVDSAKINRAIEILVREASPEKIVLFGSYARGEGGPDSDVDFLVIETDPVDRHREMVRLRRALSPMRIPVDIVVKGVKAISDWGSIPGSFLFDALNEGRVVYEKP